MKRSKHTLPHFLAASTMALAVAALSQNVLPASDGAMTASIVIPFANVSETPVADLPDSANVRIAKRLQKRLVSRYWFSPPLASLVSALEEQHALLKKSVDVTLVTNDAQTLATWTASLQEHPYWIQGSFQQDDAHFVLDSGVVGSTLMTMPVAGIPRVQNASITSLTSSGNVLRVNTDTVGKVGYAFDTEKAASAIIGALQNGESALSVELLTVAPQIINGTGEDLGELSLLSTGLSDYKGSPAARNSNVEKALRQHVNNVLVPAGATFSFNETLGGPVSQSRGWKMAKVIVEGTQLVMQPGGGICQASTTTYRAIINAGFAIGERKSHSLYVTYYEKFGVGIDATVYPGSQDLTFVNDSPHALLIQAYNEGTQAVVNIYGTPDGRKVALTGPYFAGTEPEGFEAVNGRLLRGGEIGWMQNVTYGDNRSADSAIVSRYFNLPRSVKVKYSMHASAQTN